MPRCWIEGVAVLGPGLAGWPASRAILAGEAPWLEAPAVVPPPALLAATERRRASLVVRLALAAAAEAVAGAGREAAALDSLFASSNGDGGVVGAILEALAAPEGDVSPTQFHNSVHNAAAGYWSIGAGARRGSVSIGCHDDTWPAGLLQGAAQVAAWGRPLLLCGYDAPLPEPLAAARPTAIPFAAALVLAPEPGPRSLAAIEVAHGGPLPPEVQPGPLRRALEGANPIARALPLLEALAAGRPARIGWPLLDGLAITLRLEPCHAA